MIPEQAIQAAAETFAYATGDDWHQVSAPDQEIYLQEARAALEAALPHIRTQIASELRSAAARLDPGSRGQGEYLIHGLEQAALLVEAEGNR